MKWIHQVCSEMTCGQIRQIAGKERYAFECRKCREPSKTTGTIVPGTPDENVTPSPEVPDRAERYHRVRRGKRRHPTEDHKETRRRRKKTIRENRRAERTKHKLQEIKGISTRDQNRSRLRRAVEHARQQKWRAVMISEIRSEQEGIKWLRDKPNQAVVIHSQKCGVLLLGDLLEEWIASGQQKSFSERVTAVQIGRLRLIATYQPLWSKGPEEIQSSGKIWKMSLHVLQKRVYPYWEAIGTRKLEEGVKDRA